MQAFSQGVFENQFESLMGRAVNAKQLFTMLDQNGDGKISYAEFLAGASDKAELLNEERLRMAYNVLDADGDGHVSVQEIRQRFSYENLLKNPEIEDVNEAFWDQFVAEIDQDGSGVITFEKFSNHMKTLLVTTARSKQGDEEFNEFE